MKFGFVICSAMAALLAAGCSHTVQGIQEDAKNNAPIAQAASQQAGEALSQADQATSAAVAKAGVKLAKLDKQADIALATPEIKADIIADKDFDNNSNKINVNSSEQGVYLKGHVSSSALKSKAAQIASSVISKRNLPVSLHDELTVKPG